MSVLYVWGGRREEREGRGPGEGGKDQTLKGLFTAHLGLDGEI